MKIFVAAVMSESSDHSVFAALSKDGIYDQIVEMGRAEYGDPEDVKGEWEDDYVSYSDYIFSKYFIQAEREVDL